MRFYKKPGNITAECNAEIIRFDVVISLVMLYLRRYRGVDATEEDNEK